jgi:hypothetical protein
VETVDVVTVTARRIAMRTAATTRAVVTDVKTSEVSPTRERPFVIATAVRVTTTKKLASIAPEANEARASLEIRQR